MAKSKRSAKTQTDPAGLAHSPAYPLPPQDVVAELQRALQGAECRPGWQLCQLHFSHLCGLPPATVNDWLCTNHAARFSNFICALERLSEDERTRLFRRICRPCPRLSDSMLAHDPAAVSALESLLRRPTGLTLLVGASDALRTYVLTALGNSAYRINQRLNVCGIDLHNPTNFSPVPGLAYFLVGFTPKELEQSLVQIRTRVTASRAKLVLLNCVWSMVPRLRPEILELPRESHVILADEFESGSLNMFRERQLATRIVKILPREGKPSWIRIQVENLSD